MNNYGMIDLASIAPNPRNPRKHYDEKKMGLF